jgi:hypothetical protein
MFSTEQFVINQQMSLYIPHVFSNFDELYIANVFEGLEYGRVSRVDLVAKIDKNDNIYNAAYIHFSEWNNSIIVENFQARVADSEKQARIVHDDPWYWIVLENKAKKHIPGERKQRINIIGDSYLMDDNMFEEGEEEEEYEEEYEEEGELQLNDNDKNSIIVNLEHNLRELELEIENEHFEVIDLELKLEKERWVSVNVQYLNSELEQKCCELEEQIDKEMQHSCAISEQYEKAVNDVRHLKNIEGKMIEDLESANERGLHFAEQVSDLKNELGDKEEILEFLLEELKSAENLNHLRSNVKSFFEERKQNDY